MQFYKKHPFLFALLIFAIAMGGVCYVYLSAEHLDREQITALVQSNADMLTNIAVSDAPEKAQVPDGVQKVSVIDGTVDFYCGASGTGAQSVYYGFYYTADDIPDAVCCAARFALAEELSIDGQGFSVRRNERDTYYYTEQLAPHFYYYEAHF